MLFLKLAWRNLWRNRKRTLITVSAITFAVVAAVFMQSINRGSHEVMIDNMVRFHTGYVQLQDYRYDAEPSLDNSFFFDDEIRDRVKKTYPETELVLPRIETFMLAGNEHTTRGALVLGILPEQEDAFSGLKNHLADGRFFDPAEQAAVVTKGLAERLQLSIGDQLLLIGQGRFGMSANGLFEITGILDHPLRDMNNQTVYIPLETAQFLLSADDHITALLVHPGGERHVRAAANAFNEEFSGDDLKAYTWPEMMPELLQLLEFDLVGAYFMSGILYIVIGFGFFGTILTMTLERTKEFGVLVSVGMSRVRLGMVLFLETLFISITGVISGVVAAWLILYWFYLNPIELSGEIAETVIEMGWEPVLPMSFAADQFYMQGLIVFVIAMFVFLFPLIKIMRLNILEAARS